MTTKEMSRAGQPCPRCRDTKAGTLVRHCPLKILDCDWLVCKECDKFGHPEGRWLPIALPPTE